MKKSSPKDVMQASSTISFAILDHLAAKEREAKKRERERNAVSVTQAAAGATSVKKGAGATVWS